MSVGLRASIEAQLHEVPARVLVLDDQRVFELAMVENLQREDLNAIDKASCVPRIPVSLRRYAGRAGRPAGPRPFDRLEPDPAARASRRGPGRGAHQRDLPGPRPGPARLTRRGEPGRRLPQNRRRSPFGPPDRGPGQPGRPHAIASQGPQGRGPRPTTPSLPIFSISNCGSTSTWARPS